MKSRVVTRWSGWLLAPLLLVCACEQPAPVPQKTSETANATATSPAKAAKPPVKKGDAPAKKGVPTLADAKGSYKIDPGHSVAVFAVSHAGLSTSYGRFNKMSGALTVDADAAKSSIELEIDAKSIFTADRKRDEHLLGPDFFNVAQFPTITLKSKSITAVGDGQYTIKGDLTLHGVTKEVSTTMKHVGAGEFAMDKSFRTGFEGEFRIKRSDFDMKNMIGPVGDDVRVIISIEAIRG